MPILCLCLMEQLTHQDLLQQLKAKGQGQPVYTRALIKEKLADADQDIATTSCKTQNHVQARPRLQAPSLYDPAATYSPLTQAQPYTPRPTAEITPWFSASPRVPGQHTVLVILLSVLLLLVMLLPTAGPGAWYNQTGESDPTVPLKPMHEPTVTRPAAAEPHPEPLSRSLLDTALGEALAGQVLQEMVREIIKDAIR